MVYTEFASNKNRCHDAKNNLRPMTKIGGDRHDTKLRLCMRTKTSEVTQIDHMIQQLEFLLIIISNVRFIFFS